jgi:hypothetical protein
MPKGIFKHKKGYKRTFTPTWRDNMSRSHTGKPCPWNAGEKSARWKGGITTTNVIIKTSPEYIAWRKSVFVRDSFTCQKYNTKGGKLCAHHINNFADFPELRLAIDNGITLSEKAHKEFHKKYGKKNNTKEQLEEFLYGTG